MTSEEKNDDQAGGRFTASDESPEMDWVEPGGLKQGNDFLADAETSQAGLVMEFVDFLKYNKKWWLIPILLVMALIAVLVVISASGGAPFIYALF
ncbi:MAG: DUF5989 family protein [Pirellulaceae bacterium]|nr:DUF5989 family protein [Pirellulaceae bacterium]